MPNAWRHSNTLLIGPVLLGIASVTVLLAGTRWGIGISPDSVTYMRSTDPGIHAPLYALVLWAFRSAGLDMVHSAKWLNIILINANILLIWAGLFFSTRSQGAAFIGAWLALTSATFLAEHGSVASEPLFFLWMLLSLLLLSRHLETEKLWLLLAASITAGFAVMTRYAGVALLASGALSILLLAHAGFRKRIILSAAFCIIGLAPLVIWVATHRIHTGRELAFLGTDNSERLFGGVLSLARFLVPTFVPVAGRLTLLVVVIGGLIALLVAYSRRDQTRLPKPVQTPVFAKLPYVLAAFVVMYSALLVATIVIQPYILIFDRLLVPIYLAAILLAFPLVQWVLKPRAQLRLLYSALLVFTMALALSNTARATKWVIEHYQDGSGYASRAWQTSELIAHARAFNPSASVYSNDSNALTFLTGRPAHELPRKFNPITGRSHPSYQVELEAMREDLKGSNGLVVYFTNEVADWYWYLPSLEELIKVLPMKKVKAFKDGVIYQIESQQGAHNTLGTIDRSKR